MQVRIRISDLDESSYCAASLKRFNDGGMPAAHYVEIIFWQKAGSGSDHVAG